MGALTFKLCRRRKLTVATTTIGVTSDDKDSDSDADAAGGSADTAYRRRPLRCCAALCCEVNLRVCATTTFVVTSLNHTHGR
jgi:hypothetical protein